MSKFNVGDVVRIVDTTISQEWLGLECEVLPPTAMYDPWLKPLTPRPDAGTYTKNDDPFHWPVSKLERVKAVDTLEALKAAVAAARREGYKVKCTLTKTVTETKEL